MKTFLPEQEHLYFNTHLLVRFAVKSRINALLKRIKNNDVVLEAGSGEGFITLLLARKAKRILGIDIEKRFIENAKRRINKAKIKNVQFKYGNILNFNSRTKFDKIICSEVLEHLENPFEAVKNLANLLKPQGKLIITIPNEKILDIARKIAFPRKWKQIKENTNHKSELDSKMISEMGHKLKLRTVEIKKLPIPILYINELIVLEK